MLYFVLSLDVKRCTLMYDIGSKKEELCFEYEVMKNGRKENEKSHNNYASTYTGYDMFNTDFICQCEI